MSISNSDTMKNEVMEFIYVVSHDLHAPLRTMVEFCNLLESENSDSLNEDSKHYLSLIISGGKKMQKMLESLLELSRLSSMYNPQQDLDYNLILKDCINILNDTIEDTRAVIEIAAMPIGPGDADLLTKLFSILINNSLKFQRPGNIPNICISSNKRENERIFKIQDNGIGIEPEYYEQIFKPFARLHNDQEYPGIGMGLTLAKKIVNQHDGHIWIEPSPTSTGVTVTFSVSSALKTQ